MGVRHADCRPSIRFWDESAHDHRLKDEGGRTVIEVSAGTFDWTSRLGQHYRRHREPVIEDLPDPQDRPLPRQSPNDDTDHDPERMLATVSRRPNPS